MRPLKLKLQGLRSYHTERELDLSGEQLLAIIGDTGAGKSSLLEAIVYALYAGPTWSGRDASELISDRTGQMVVELEFEAEGEIWRVRRTMSKGSRPSEHELVCLSDPDKEKADGARAVNPRIEKLVGLDQDQFCSAVLLPQGKFDQLLKAPPGVRVEVLKGLLGLERVDRLRDQAGELEKLLSERWAEIVDRRGKFLSDPEASGRAAQELIDKLEPDAKRFEAAQKALERANADADQLERRAARIEQAADALEERLTGDAAKLEALEEVERGIKDRRKPLETERVRVKQALAESDEQVEQAKRERRDKATLERAVETIEAAHDQVECLEVSREALQGKLSEANALRDTIKLAEEGMPALETALTTAAGEADKAATALEQEQQRQREAAEARSALETKLMLHEGAQRRLGENEKAAGPAQKKADVAKRELEAATKARERAERELGRLVALEPVAALAHICHSGDPCPVCQRGLPDDFVPPDVDGLEQAREAARQAQEDERRANQAKADATAALTQLVDARSALERECEEAAAELSDAEKGVRSASEQLSGLDGKVLFERAHKLADGDEASLAELRSQAEAKERARAEAKDARDSTRNQIAGDRRLLASADQANAAEQRRIEDERVSLFKRLAKLCSPLKLSAEPTAAELATGLQELERLKPQAEQVEADHAKLLAEQSRIQDGLEALDRELQTEVREPAIKAHTNLDGLRRALEQLSGSELPPAPDLGAEVRELAVWGEAVEQALWAELTSQRQQAQRLREEAATKHSDALGQLVELGVKDREAFEERRIELLSALTSARRDLKQADAQLESVATLDALRARTEALRAAFAGLYEALLQRNFIQYAVGNRQRALLAAASTVLKEITGDRYGFADDFRIVDKETGQARAARTLSGGETFLASLALALGLVEVIARSGGRLDALFLDEGFGSLDPNALQEALGALERRAKAGRLVALISHVPLVAEQIERVLEVTKDHEGSDVRLLSGDERSELAFAAVAEEGLP